MPLQSIDLVGYSLRGVATIQYKMGHIAVATIPRFGHRLECSVSLSLSACRNLVCVGLLAMPLNLFVCYCRHDETRGGRKVLVLLWLEHATLSNGPIYLESLPYPIKRSGLILVPCRVFRAGPALPGLWAAVRTVRREWLLRWERRARLRPVRLLRPRATASPA